MYNYRYRRFGWLPILLLFFFVFALFSGGFHHAWFFFAPVFLCLPFLVIGGIAMFMAARWRFAHHWHEHGRGNYYRDTDHHDNDSDIFYA